MDKLKGDTEEAKAAFKEKMRKQEQEKIMKEKKEKAEALKKIRAQVDEEKKQRIEKTKQKQETVQYVEKTSSIDKVEQKKEIVKKQEPKKDEPKVFTPKEYDSCLVQCRLPDGNVMQSALKPDSTLYDLALVICQQTGLKMTDFSIVTPFPRKEFESQVFSSVTVKDVGLVPKGSVTIQKVESKGIILKGKDVITPDEPDIEDPDLSDPDYQPKPLPLPIDPIITEPEDEDAIARTTKLICCVWLLSNEECPEETTILVYRPVDYQFEKVVNNRKAICFSDDGTFSETIMDNGVKQTRNGTWALKNHATELVMKLGNQTNTVQLATVTDEVLILS